MNTKNLFYVPIDFYCSIIFKNYIYLNQVLLRVNRVRNKMRIYTVVLNVHEIPAKLYLTILLDTIQVFGCLFGVERVFYRYTVQYQ